MAPSTSNPNNPSSGSTNSNNNNNNNNEENNKVNLQKKKKIPSKKYSAASKKSKGFSYSCTGNLIYTSEMKEKNQLPICVGISGRLKEVELLHTSSKPEMQKRPNTEDKFMCSCLGYSRVILQQQPPNGAPFRKQDGTVVGLPRCEVGVNLSTVVAQPRTTTNQNLTKIQQQNSNAIIDDMEAELSDDEKKRKNLDRDVEKLRRRFRQVVEFNETDPNTWRHREWIEKQNELMKQQLHKQQQQDIALFIGKALEKWQNYAIKLSHKTLDSIKQNGRFVYAELTHPELPRRIYKSSERIVQHFGPTATLCQKTLYRAKDTIMDSVNNYLWKGGRGGDK